MRLPVLIIVIFCALVPAECQWTSVATNSDGTQIYFVSRLRQESSSQATYGKLFIADSSGVRPLLIRNKDITAVSVLGASQYLTNAYDIVGVDVAADVSRMAVVAESECHVSETICSGDSATTTVYDSKGNGTDFRGRGRLSPDGRWVSLINISSFFFGLGPTPASVTNLTDNSTSTFVFPNSIRDYRSGSVANNGYFAFGGGTQGLDLAPLNTAVTSLAGNAINARIDAGGTTAIWAQRVNGTTAIVAANTQTQETRTLLSSSDDAYDPSISSDGTRAIFLKADNLRVPQAFLIGSDGSGLTQVTREPAGVTDAMLSPDGQSVVAISGDGSLLRFRYVTGARDVVIGPALSINAIGYVGSPGQVVRIFGTDLDSATVQVDGRQAPIIASTPTYVTFQVPWETSYGDSLPLIVASAKPGSKWEGGGQSTLASVKTYPSWNFAIHQNFEGLVTPSSPAHAGEIVHLYAAGLGPVLNPPSTGRPAPDSPLSPLIAPLRFVLSLPGVGPNEGTDQTAIPDVLFAGLAPRTIGYYQVSIRLPGTLGTGIWSLESRTDDGFLQPTSITLPIVNGT